MGNIKIGDRMPLEVLVELGLTPESEVESHNLTGFLKCLNKESYTRSISQKINHLLYENNKEKTKNFLIEVDINLYENNDDDDIAQLEKFKTNYNSLIFLFELLPSKYFLESTDENLDYKTLFENLKKDFIEKCHEDKDSIENGTLFNPYILTNKIHYILTTLYGLRLKNELELPMFAPISKFKMILTPNSLIINANYHEENIKNINQRKFYLNYDLEEALVGDDLKELASDSDNTKINFKTKELYVLLKRNTSTLSHYLNKLIEEEKNT